MKPVDEMDLSDSIELFIAMGEAEREDEDSFEEQFDQFDSMIAE